MGRMLWAVVWLVLLSVAAHIAAMVLSFTVFWPDAFTRSEIDDYGIVGWAIILGCVRVFMQDLVAMGGIIAKKKPSSRTIVLRFLAAAGICALTIVYCMGIVYYGLVLPEIKTPLFVVFNIWILSMFPMLFLMTHALHGVYYLENVRREDIVRKNTLSLRDKTKHSVKEKTEKKPVAVDV